MPVQPIAETAAHDVAAAAAQGTRFARVAAFAAAYTFLLIVFGGIVRITGSGLGCGDDWPLCDGRLIPPADLAAWIEWSHRLLAAGLVLPVALVAHAAWRQRAHDALGGPNGAARPAFAAIGLLALQVALGAITVKLDLPAGITALHFVTALLMLGALTLAAIRARPAPNGADTTDRADTAGARRRARAAAAATLIGLATVTFGALTANTGLHGAATAPSAAAWACQGFPLCNGSILPEGAAFTHIHWTHRLLAYLLLLHVAGAAVGTLRRERDRSVRLAAAASLALVAAQVAVAAGLVLMHLPASMRVLHLITGAALWVALVAWHGTARRAAAA